MKAPLRAALKDGSFSIPAMFSHQCQGQFLPLCWGMSIPVFPTGERRVFLQAEPVSCFQSQLPPSPPSHCLVAPAAFHDPTSALNAASQWLHGWGKTPSLMEVCGILLCFDKSSSSEEEQNVMDQSCSELALLKRGKMQEEPEHANPNSGLILVIPGRASSRIAFSSALCPLPEGSSSLRRVCWFCHAWVSITGGQLESSAFMISGPQVGTKT